MRLRGKINLLFRLSIKYFGRNQIEYGQCKGCKTFQRRGRSESQGAPVGSGPGGDPVQALFHSYRRRLRSMDQTVYLFPWQTPSEGNGGDGNRGISDGFGGAFAASTQNQALSALVFLDQEVLHI